MKTEDYFNIGELETINSGFLKTVNMVRIEEDYIRIDNIIRFEEIRTIKDMGGDKIFEFDIIIKTYNGERCKSICSNNKKYIEKIHEMLKSCFNIVELKEDK